MKVFNSNFSIKIIAVGALILLSYLTYFFISYDTWYDVKAYKTLLNKIIWTENSKLTWDDFEYSPNKPNNHFYASIGLSTRYDIDEPIFFRSKTVFDPNKSWITDTTDMATLRIAQMKFDLMEIYRRKMIDEVDSIRNHKIKVDKIYFEKLGERFYNLFEDNWNGILTNLVNDDSLDTIEQRIKIVLVSNNSDKYNDD